MPIVSPDISNITSALKGLVPVNLVLAIEHLAVFAYDINSGAPVTGVPLFAVAELGPVQEGGEQSSFRYPLGMVCTDHAGYASFDLTVVRHHEVYRQIQKMFGTNRLLETLRLGADKAVEAPIVVQLTGLKVLPFGDSALGLDALHRGDRGPDFVYLRLDLDDHVLQGRALNRAAVSMQSPNIRDWRLSPASFSIAGALLIGEDGCETLVPSNLATQVFRFHQLARQESAQQSDDTYAEGVPFSAGWILEMKAEWFPIGHSLGQILYSLPLAPGEKRRIAVLDWSRSERVGREESTGVSEQLAHDQVRDRTVSETVSSALKEWQKGESFSWGLGLSGGGGGNSGNLSIGVGASFGIGGGSASSQGERAFSAESLQRLTDAFRQASASMRELRSTVMVQSEQKESGTAQTRVVANYNHSHALTLLYYEVLRHYRVVTGTDRQRPALFVTRPRPAFTEESVLVNRQAIGRALLDAALKPTLDLLFQSRNGAAVPVAALELLLLHLNSNSMYYHRAIWQAESLYQMTDWLATLFLGGRRLDRLVESAPVDVVGDAYVFPVLRGQEGFVAQSLGVSFSPEAFVPDQLEQLLTLPTRGMFAEAKLGHCNASEVIDSTRFWDWQQSPIPDDASDIAALDLGTPSRTPPVAAPTALPASLLNIVNPPAAPDPTGLATVLGTMSALGAFRDMSGRDTTGALLAGLTNTSGQLAAKGLEGANARALTSLQNQQVRHMVDTIRNARELTPEQRTELIGRVLSSGVDAMAPTRSSNPSPATSGSGGSGAAAGGSSTGAGGNTSQPSAGSTGRVPSEPVTERAASTGASRPSRTTHRPARRTSSLMRQLLFVFKFDTQAPMVGSFRVRLLSGTEALESTAIENTVSNYASAAAGATEHDIGNRVLISVPQGFGGQNDVQIQVDGDIVSEGFIVEDLTVMRRRVNTRVRGWSRPVLASATMTRASFDATRTWDVVMPTVEDEHTVTHSFSLETASSSGSEQGSGNTVGTTLGGSGVVYEAHLNVEHVTTATTSDSTSVTRNNQEERTIKYLVRRVANSQQPIIRPIGGGT